MSLLPRKRIFFHMFPPWGVRYKECLVPASQSPRIQSWELSSLTLSPSLPCPGCCCHHKLETHPQGPGKPVSW